MLEIKGKIHDQYTLEFKVGYAHGDKKNTVSDFVMNTWIFVPDTLYINAKTYPKGSFYRDVRSFVRLITPVYTLKQLSEQSMLPFSRLRKAASIPPEKAGTKALKNYEHQAKMFGNIVRSALRTEAEEVGRMTDEAHCTEALEEMTGHLTLVLSGYRDTACTEGFGALPETFGKCFRRVDEYLYQVVAHHLMRLYDQLEARFPEGAGEWKGVMTRFLDEQDAYRRQRGYLSTKAGDGETNRTFLQRAGRLKKYVESDLYLLAHKRSNTFVLQQVLFMLAAGMSMVFATVVSFFFQQTYGNFTQPLFMALVISYMFKDRMKDLLRYWFSNKVGSKFYDYKTKLAMNGEPIGWGKEGFDFVGEERLPSDIKALREGDEELDACGVRLRESVILYRRRVLLFGKRLRRMSHYPLQGVNEIIRLNLRSFLRRMDNPYIPVYVYEPGGRLRTEPAEKPYHLVLVIQFVHEKQVSYKRYRISLNRRGLRSFEEW